MTAKTAIAAAEPNRPTPLATVTTTAAAAIGPVRVPRCRYLIRTGRGTAGVELSRCTGEVAAPGAEIDLCSKRLANALALLRRAGVSS